MTTRPNIVFYFSDQQRWDTLGCYGQRLPVTPNLDSIAAEGTRYANAFTCQPVCGPARACLQSGKYATRTGCFRNDIELPTGCENRLADLFNVAGYDTAYVGKWHLASNKAKGIDHRTEPIPPEYRGGYSYWMAADVLEFTSHGYNGYVYDGDMRRREFIGYRADCINNFAIDYLHSRDRSKPFFLFISQIEPHHQNDHGIFEGPDGSKARFADFDVPGDLVGTGGDWRENYPDYLGQCASLDYNVGRLVDTLRETGDWDNTIFIYTSDHGSHFCTRNREYKRSCHDGCTHIPLIIHGGAFSGNTDNTADGVSEAISRDIRNGKVEDAMVSLIDLPATLLDCAGIDIPESWDGRSLLPLAEGRAKDWDDSVFMQISESQVGRAVRTRDWKYSVRADAKGWQDSSADVYYEDFLYDLNADPHERNNLVADEKYRGIRENLKQLLLKHMEKAGETLPTILPYSEMPEVLKINF